MKRPIHAFHEHVFSKNAAGSKKGSLQSLQAQLAQLEKLTRLAQPILPRGENWQVVSFQQGVLCVAAEHFAAMSQLRYLQTHYVKQLQSIADFAGITRIKVIVETKPTPKTVSFSPLPELSNESRQAIYEAATLIHDRELSQALQRLASKK